MRDLLAKGELWLGLKKDVESDMGKRRSLDALFDFCKRMTQPPSSGPSSPEKPCGVHADLSAAKLVWEWLKRTCGVTGPDVGPHILTEKSMAYPLKGRDEAVTVVTDALITMCTEQLKATKDRSEREIPVCSALSGLGKTRMAEEVCAAFAEPDGSHRAKLWKTLRDAIKGPRIGVIVTYGNGVGRVRSIEKQFSIESSFAWRLLYFFFLRSRPGLSLEEFMKKRIPSNSAELSFRNALETVLVACRECEIVTYDHTLCLFVGVDEYQKIAMDIDPGYAAKLVDAFSALHADPVPGLVVLPMLTGTDLGVVGSVGSSSNSAIVRVPMRLLGVEECEESIEAVMPELLEHQAARRHLFELSGVARWSIVYAKRCAKINDGLTAEKLIDARDRVSSQYLVNFGHLSQVGTETSQSGVSDLVLIEVVAWALSGQAVNIGAKVQGFSWTRLRDGGLCLIDGENCVSVPYVLVSRVASMDSDIWPENPACQYLIEALDGLRDGVDEQFYRHEPWHLWELFGAYFHAARINALQVIGKRVMKACKLFSGALVNGCIDKVVLRPVRVFRAAAACQYGEDLGDEISRMANEAEKRHWITGDQGIGTVVVNGSNGQGVDIFFCFKREGTDQYLVCVDQRKRVAKALGQKVAVDLLECARGQTPSILEGAVVIAGLCSMFPNYHGDADTLPSNSFVVSRSCSGLYHGGLAGHPASRPFVDVNMDPKAWIGMFLVSKKAIVASLICEQRKKARFENFGELETFVLSCGGTMQPKAELYLHF